MGSSILRKKILWPWIFHSGSSRSLWGPTYDTSFLFTLLPVQPSRSLFLQSVEDAKEKGGRKGGRGGKKGKRKFPPGFFSCLRFFKFYGPDCLGTWNRLVQQSLCLPGEGRDGCKGVQWIVLHDAAPAFSISCPVHCTAKLAELEGSEALLWGWKKVGFLALFTLVSLTGGGNFSLVVFLSIAGRN